MSKIVRIGAATAFFNDIRMGIALLLGGAGPDGKWSEGGYWRPSDGVAHS